MKRHPLLLGLIVGCFIGWGASYLPHFAFRMLNRAIGVDQSFVKYHQITPEMDQKQVIAIMGSPGERSATFKLSQEPSYEMEYYVAKRIGAAYFVSWRAFPDVTVTVAFDANDRAIYKAIGTT